MRIEDTAKYSLNFGVISAHYKPKTRITREDPLPDSDPNKFYAGDNQNRISGQSNDFKQRNIHAWEAYEMGQDIHLQAATSQAEPSYKKFKVKKETLKKRSKQDFMDKYGNAASVDRPPDELLLGCTERQVRQGMLSRDKRRLCLGASIS